jgi:hypothetical protein
MVIVVTAIAQLIFVSQGQKMASPSNVYSLAALSCSIVLVVACMFCAEEKGYSRNYGLLGFLSVFGVILLAILPRKEKWQ